MGARRPQSPILSAVPGSQVYEVRCDYCQTSFAPGTRRCLHCGRRLRAARALESGRVLARTTSDEEVPEWLPEAEEEAAADDRAAEQILLQRRGRNVLWIATAILALLGSLLRHCQ